MRKSYGPLLTASGRLALDWASFGYNSWQVPERLPILDYGKHFGFGNADAGTGPSDTRKFASARRPSAPASRPLAALERRYKAVDHFQAPGIARCPDTRGMTDHAIPSIEDECDGGATKRVREHLRVVLVREASEVCGARRVRSLCRFHDG